MASAATGLLARLRRSTRRLCTRSKTTAQERIHVVLAVVLDVRRELPQHQDHLLICSTVKRSPQGIDTGRDGRINAGLR